jgi:hypothetical protein
LRRPPALALIPNHHSRKHKAPDGADRQGLCADQEVPSPRRGWNDAISVTYNG